MSFNSLISDFANDLNNNPVKKADLVNFPTKLDFEFSKTIIETVKSMQPGNSRMIAAVAVDGVVFSLRFVHAEELETVKDFIVRISENAMPQTAAELSSKLAGYCLAKDQKGKLHIDIADASNVKSCRPFKCDAAIFEQINVADCAPISFNQSIKPGPDPEQKEIWRQVRQLKDGESMTIAKESIDGTEYNFVYKNAAPGGSAEQSDNSIIFTRTPLFFKYIKSAADIANDLEQYCIHRSTGSGNYDILTLGNGCEAQDKATKLSNCKADDFAATTAQFCLPAVQTQPLLWEQVHDLSASSNVAVATINLNDQNLGIQYSHEGEKSSIGNVLIKLDRTTQELQKIDNAAALSADLAKVYLGDDDNGGVKICTEKSEKGCYPPANIECNSKLFNKVEVSSQCEQILTADHKFPIWQRVSKLENTKTFVPTLGETIDDSNYLIEYSLSKTAPLSGSTSITKGLINIGLAKPAAITNAEVLKTDLEKYHIRRTKDGKGYYEFANQNSEGVKQLLPVGCEAKNFNKAFAQDCGAITTQPRLWESIKDLAFEETIPATKIKISGQEYEVSYERKLPDSGQEIDNTNFLITLYEVNMAQTAQQIAVNINKRYVYYDKDGELQIKDLKTDSTVTVNGIELTPGDKGIAVKFECTAAEFQGLSPGTCKKLEPTKPAWVQLKDLSASTSEALARVNIKLLNKSTGKASDTATAFDIKYATSKKTPSIVMTGGNTITLPKGNTLCKDSCSAENLKTNINSYQIGYNTDEKLDIKSTTTTEGYKQLNCQQGFEQLSCTDIEMQLRIFQQVNSATPKKVATQTINGQEMNLNYKEGEAAQTLNNNDITIIDQAVDEL